MLDMRLIREQPDVVREGLRRRGSHAPLEEILALDAERRSLLVQVESLKAERNETSRRVPAMQDHAERAAAVQRMRIVGEAIARLDTEVGERERQLNRLLLELPNIPDPGVPDGASSADNAVVRTSGEPPALQFEPKPHWVLGEQLGIINFEQGQRLSGSRFYVLHGDGARLQRGLIAWMLDLHRDQGYSEVSPPYVVREQTLWNSGNLPDFENNMYHDAEDDIWLIPTSEVPLTSLHAGEILPASRLPLAYTAYSPNWRRESMSAGRDVRGLKRGHQFDKVEMYYFTLPEESDATLDTLTRHAEETCRLLGLTYRMVELCTGDLGFKARRTYDVEVWSPGVGEWLEVSSCSNVGDFQARRAGVRFKRGTGGRTEFVHTLNGSGLGVPRTMIAILENYQQGDGSVAVPAVLQPYLGGQKVIAARQ